MISAKYAALFGYGGPNAYFPAIWFAEADDSHLTDAEKNKGVGADGGPAAKRSVRRYDEEEDRDYEQEEHVAKRHAHQARLYAPKPDATLTDEGAIQPAEPTKEAHIIEPVAKDAGQAPATALLADELAALQAEAAQVAADAIARARRQRQEEEALILILSHFID